ncbi:MAG: UDP-N-acetylmuramoyl-L-alanine--D-glutamate ligase [Ilumatobacteraceae bacterium]
MTGTAYVHGLAASGEALCGELLRRGWRVLAADDSPTDTTRAAAARLGTTLVERPSPAQVEQMVAAADIVCPAPGVPESHHVIEVARAAGRPLRTEIDLAYEWEQQRPGGPRPMLAVTGTDGKTTTTLMAAHLAAGAGHRVAAVGNTETPLVAALSEQVDMFVVECSSFRLAWIDSFRAEASAWLNLAPDHLNWHRSLDAYVDAKARMWRHCRSDDVAIGAIGDPTVMAHLRRYPGPSRTFGTTGADYRLDGDMLVGPAGAVAPLDALPRRLPHDITNTLAAAALVIESGLGTAADIAASLPSFRHPAHRIEPVGEIDGVRWFNDSKATTPHAALTAIRSFDRIVLLAGGRNKGLDLGSLAVEHGRVAAVVGLGEAAGEVTAAFEGRCPTVVAGSMAEAVDAASRLAQPGDVVLLSPACASFDWYPEGGYPARGDDFRRLVAALAAASSSTKRAS